MNKHGIEVEKVTISNEMRQEFAMRIIERPEIIIDKISETKSSFSKTDIAQELNRYIDDRDQFQSLMLVLANHPSVRKQTRTGKPNSTLYIYATKSLEELQKIWRKEFNDLGKVLRERVKIAGLKNDKIINHQQKKIDELKQQEPRKPRGLLAIFKRRTYEKNHAEWQAQLAQAEKRKAELMNRCNKLINLYAFPEPNDPKSLWKISGTTLTMARMQKMLPDLHEAINVAKTQKRNEKYDEQILQSSNDKNQSNSRKN